MLFNSSNFKLGIWIFSQLTIYVNSQSKVYDVPTVDYKYFSWASSTIKFCQYTNYMPVTHSIYGSLRLLIYFLQVTSISRKCLENIFSYESIFYKSLSPRGHTHKNFKFTIFPYQNFCPTSPPKKIHLKLILRIYITPSHKKESNLCSIIYSVNIADNIPPPHQHMRKTFTFTRCKSQNLHPKSLLQKICIKRL